MRRIAKFSNFSRFYSTIKSVPEFESKLEKIKSCGQVAFTTFVKPELHNNTLYGISFATSSDDVFYLPLITEDIPYPTSFDVLKQSPYYPLLVRLFNDSSIKKISHDVKSHLKNLHPYGVKMSNFDDVMIMAYVLYCGKMGTDFDVLSERLLNETISLTEREILGLGQKKKTWLESPVDQVSDYVNQFTKISLKLFDSLSEAMMKQTRLTRFYREIELPLVETLAQIELNGVFVDKESFASMETEYSTKIQTIEKTIREHSGSDELNINSPHQIGQFLVEILNVGVDVIKKSDKTGKYLTDFDSLEKIDHPIAKLVLEHRALSKIYSTYIIGFQKHISPWDGRIHTVYQNALTVTGRLSSTSPNLQNIPNRSAEGRKIRQNIIAPVGHSIIKADYSQVELRILAHVANIPVLREAFKNGKDVHTITAQQVFQVEQVPKELRQKAKAINFGIIYGMSEYGLSKQINVPIKQAKEYIKQYFAQYPGIEKFMKNTKQFCRDQGYVNTLFGRRCWIPEINGDSSTKRGFAERTSINTPIQGTSADITKIAMNRLREEFDRLGMKTRMIIQVHDEIVFEAPNEEIEQAKAVIKKIMESVGDSVQFSIPLTVDVSVSERWCE